MIIENFYFWVVLISSWSAGFLTAYTLPTHPKYNNGGKKEKEAEAN